MTQEQEARAYNRAFLHGKEVGLEFGRCIAIDEVLEIIDEERTRNGLNLKQTAEIRRRVEAMKGEQG